MGHSRHILANRSSNAPYMTTNPGFRKTSSNITFMTWDNTLSLYSE